MSRSCGSQTASPSRCRERAVASASRRRDCAVQQLLALHMFACQVQRGERHVATQGSTCRVKKLLRDDLPESGPCFARCRAWTLSYQLPTADSKMIVRRVKAAAGRINWGANVATVLSGAHRARWTI
jgi:hypothetical protein